MQIKQKMTRDVKYQMLHVQDTLKDAQLQILQYQEDYKKVRREYDDVSAEITDMKNKRQELIDTYE